jgi:predicted 3-demethylubiquinone-9 3-methyltransferase (glyoxalase superfamily)
VVTAESSSVEGQEEVDYFWNRLTADGGEDSKCGWLKDKFGLSWQVVPTALGRYLKSCPQVSLGRTVIALRSVSLA